MVASSPALTTAEAEGGGRGAGARQPYPNQQSSRPAATNDASTAAEASDSQTRRLNGDRDIIGACCGGASADERFSPLPCPHGDVTKGQKNTIPILTYHSLHGSTGDYATNDHAALRIDLEVIVPCGYRIAPLTEVARYV